MHNNPEKQCKVWYTYYPLPVKNSTSLTTHQRITKKFWVFAGFPVSWNRKSSKKDYKFVTITAVSQGPNPAGRFRKTRHGFPSFHVLWCRAFSHHYFCTTTKSAVRLFKSAVSSHTKEIDLTVTA